MWSTNTRRGKVDQAKGRVKRDVTLTRDEPTKAEGPADETAGIVEKPVARVTRKLGDTIHAGKTVRH
jgi:uncharacterized protein YjbJ (UPF0337 family)